MDRDRSIALDDGVVRAPNIKSIGVVHANLESVAQRMSVPSECVIRRPCICPLSIASVVRVTLVDSLDVSLDI